MNVTVGRFATDSPRPGPHQPSARRRKHIFRQAWSESLGLALLLALPCGGQMSQQSQPSSNGSLHPSHNIPSDVDDALGASPAGDPVYEERRMRQLNAAQHKSMVSDTDKLLKLVNELNAEINSTNPGTLTPDQLRKVADIEKLAHSVKDKMRMSVKGTPVYMDPSPLPPISHH